MIFILLPAYNEEISIDFLLPKIHGFFQDKNNYTIIACNDGSSDGTLSKLEKYKSKIPLIIVNHRYNRGLGETARDLFEKAAELADDDDIIIRLDCDDTHEPEYMQGMIDKLNQGYDVVIASRFVKGGGQEGLTAYRRFVSRAANIFMKIFFPIKGLKEYSSGYRAYRALIIKKALDLYGNSFIQLKGLGFTGTLEKIIKLKLIGARITEAPAVLQYDQKKSPSKMVSSITTFGYIVMVLLYYWPWGGWKNATKRKKASDNPEKR